MLTLTRASKVTDAASFLLSRNANSSSKLATMPTATSGNTCTHFITKGSSLCTAKSISVCAAPSVSVRTDTYAQSFSVCTGQSEFINRYLCSIRQCMHSCISLNMHSSIRQCMHSSISQCTYTAQSVYTCTAPSGSVYTAPSVSACTAQSVYACTAQSGSVYTAPSECVHRHFCSISQCVQNSISECMHSQSEQCCCSKVAVQLLR